MFHYGYIHTHLDKRPFLLATLIAWDTFTFSKIENGIFLDSFSYYIHIFNVIFELDVYPILKAAGWQQFWFWVSFDMSFLQLPPAISNSTVRSNNFGYGQIAENK